MHAARFANHGLCCRFFTFDVNREIDASIILIAEIMFFLLQKQTDLIVLNSRYTSTRTRYSSQWSNLAAVCEALDTL